MKFILEKLGQDPKHSLLLFMRGLGLFIIGVIFVFLGFYTHHYWQIVGIVFLGLGVLIAAFGYLGIFANRLLNISYRVGNLKSSRKNDSE